LKRLTKYRTGSNSGLLTRAIKDGVVIQGEELEKNKKQDMERVQCRRTNIGKDEIVFPKIDISNQ
jgi:hypothetical protein